MYRVQKTYRKNIEKGTNLVTHSYNQLFLSIFSSMNYNFSNMHLIFKLYFKILSCVGYIKCDKQLHAVLNIANLLNTRNHTYTIYNHTITAIGSITITYPVVTAMHSIQLSLAAATI
jgi:hypothetical protein